MKFSRTSKERGLASEGPPPQEAEDMPIHQERALPDRPDLQQNALPIILEEELLPQAPQTPWNRPVPAPMTPVLPEAAPFERRVSVRTQEEPHMEPSLPSQPSSKASSLDGTPRDGERPFDSKRLKTSSEEKVRKRVAQLQTERLEREAMKYLKQRDRQERAERARARREGNSPSEAAASSSRPQTLPDPSQESQQDPPLPQELPAGENEDENLWNTINSSFFSDFANQHLPGFYVKLSKKRAMEVSLLAKPAKAKNAEFDMKTATPEERLGSRNRAEWDSILSLKAVRVLSKKESAEVMQNTPERVISSRMIRRRKLMPGVGAFRFKSRWCLRGHQDPDTGEFEVFSPTPSAESITMFFQVCINESLMACFLDVKNAFCQGAALDRPQALWQALQIKVWDCPPDILIEIVAPVYGLDDSPLRWHKTLLDFFLQLGFQRTLLEPSWLVKRDLKGKTVAQVLIEVDDLNFGIQPEYFDTLKKALEERFVFGKMEFNEADFAGRHIKVEADRVVMHQEKYILEKIFPHKLPKGKHKDKAEKLSPEDFEAHRSLLYKVTTGLHINLAQKLLAW